MRNRKREFSSCVSHEVDVSAAVRYLGDINFFTTSFRISLTHDGDNVGIVANQPDVAVASSLSCSRAIRSVLFFLKGGSR